VPGVDRLVASVRNASTLKKHLIDGARAHFRGTVVLAKDLLEI
jgi:hypothetical protein